MRKIVAYKRYFLDFYESQSDKLQKKIEWTLGVVRDIERIPTKYFKQVTGSKGLYEIRVEYEGNTYRIFSFFDEGNLVVLGNAFQKKTSKTPSQQLEKAKKIMKLYFDEKE